MPNIGPIEIIVVLLILLVIFGPKRIPELGRSVGQGMRNFKESVTGRDRDEPRQIEADRSAPAGEAAPERDRSAATASARAERTGEPAAPVEPAAAPAEPSPAPGSPSERGA
jgi:sec-independent protein translocase protein TatA